MWCGWCGVGTTSKSLFFFFLLLWMNIQSTYLVGSFSSILPISLSITGWQPITRHCRCRSILSELVTCVCIYIHIYMYVNGTISFGSPEHYGGVMCGLSRIHWEQWRHFAWGLCPSSMITTWAGHIRPRKPTVPSMINTRRDRTFTARALWTKIHSG
jgi:hypothetical protein